MSFGGGGSGGSGTQRFEWNDDLAPYWRSILDRANRSANTETYPYNPYNPNSYGKIGADGQRENATITRDPAHGVFRQLGGFYNDPSVTGRVAGINDDQASAMANIRALALGYTDPKTGQRIPQGGQQSEEARNYLSGVLTGQMGQNPWNGATPLDRQYGSGGAYQQWAQGNPLAGAQDVPDAYNADKVQAGKNDYAGMDSPYFNKQLDTGLKKITDAYNKGTDAQTRRMFNLAGAFGGSAHQNAVNDNEKALGEQLGNYTQNMQQQQFDRSANLAESDITRRMQADQFNVNTGSGAYENWAGRKMQGGANDLARRERGVENFLNRDIQAQQTNQNLGFSGWENARNREMSAIPLGFQTEGMGFDRMRQLMGVGDAQRSYEQSIKDTAYNEWLARSNYDKSQVDWLTGLLSRAQGGVAPNATTQYPGTQISPFGALLGAGAMYGAMR